MRRPQELTPPRRTRRHRLGWLLTVEGFAAAMVAAAAIPEQEDFEIYSSVNLKNDCFLC